MEIFCCYIPLRHCATLNLMPTSFLPFTITSTKLSLLLAVFTSFQHSLLLLSPYTSLRFDGFDIPIQYSITFVFRFTFHLLPQFRHSKSSSINHRMDELISNYSAVWWWRWFCLNGWEKLSVWVSISAAFSVISNILYFLLLLVQHHLGCAHLSSSNPWPYTLAGV